MTLNSRTRGCSWLSRVTRLMVKNGVWAIWVQTQVNDSVRTFSLFIYSHVWFKTWQQTGLTIETSGSWMSKHTYTLVYAYTQHHNYLIVTRTGFHDNRQAGWAKETRRLGERERERELQPFQLRTLSQIWEWIIIKCARQRNKGEGGARGVVTWSTGEGD